MKGWEPRLPASFPLERVHRDALREGRRRRGRRRRLYEGAATAVCLAVLVGAGLVAANRDRSGHRIVAGPGPADRFEVGPPVLSRVNGRIAFVRSTGPTDPAPRIYLMNEDGSGPTMLAETTQGGQLAWSPDGTRLAFLDVGGIYVVNADGSQERRVPASSPSDATPAWSPDGTKLAVRSLEGNTGGIAVLEVEGSRRWRLTDHTMDMWPAWSPDGTTIAFTRDDDIYVTKIDGSGQRRLTSVGAIETHPTWSPDGRQVAFRQNSTIAVVDVDGGRSRQLATPGGTAVVDPNGRGANKLAPGRGDPANPRWSPDGTKIVYAVYQSGEACSIWVMNADGSGQTALTDNRQCDRDPAWQPLPG